MGRAVDVGFRQDTVAESVRSERDVLTPTTAQRGQKLRRRRIVDISTDVGTGIDDDRGCGWMRQPHECEHTTEKRVANGRRKEKPVHLFLPSPVPATRAETAPGRFLPPDCTGVSCSSPVREGDLNEPAREPSRVAREGHEAGGKSFGPLGAKRGGIGTEDEPFLGGGQGRPRAGAGWRRRRRIEERSTLSERTLRRGSPWKAGTGSASPPAPGTTSARYPAPAQRCSPAPGTSYPQCGSGRHRCSRRS